MKPNRGPDYPTNQCTDHVAREMEKRHGITTFFFPRPNNLVRDAKVWHEQPGVRVLDAPKIGFPVQITGGPFSKHGHVAVVEKVEGSRIYVSQSNYPDPLTYSEQWFDTTDGLTYRYLDIAPVIEPSGATPLATYLASKGSPYANVDIAGACNAAGITNDQCRLLVAICGKESNHGTQYARSIKQARADGTSFMTTDRGPEADRKGMEYANCAGVKRGSWNKQYPYSSGTDGWWLVKFPDWQTFWNEYARGMKKGWFDKQADEPSELCFQYVGSPTVCESSWLNGVNFFLSEIPQIT